MSEPLAIRPRLGLGLTLLAAASYGMTPVFARLAYDGGGTALAIIGTRYWVALAALWALARVRGRAAALPSGQRRWGVVVGVLMTCIAYGYIGSVQWIPVGVAALVLYTYPILVTLGAAALLGQRAGAVKLVAILMAFAGVAIVLGWPAAPPDPRGLALAALAGVSYAAMVLVASRLDARVDALQLTFSGTLWAGLACTVAALLHDRPDRLLRRTAPCRAGAQRGTDEPRAGGQRRRGAAAPRREPDARPGRRRAAHPAGAGPAGALRRRRVLSRTWNSRTRRRCRSLPGAAGWGRCSAGRCARRQGGRRWPRRRRP
jgi:threonine/homoserine efflux transporter RhtA